MSPPQLVFPTRSQTGVHSEPTMLCDLKEGTFPFYFF